jgi:tetratricopeptide (TPR) repeat protein
MNSRIRFHRATLHSCLLIFSFLLLTLSSGCGVRDMGNKVKQSFKGQHFLSTKEFSRGVKSFEQEVRENPESDLANYYYGRFLLGDKQYKAALRYLKKAHTLEPEDIDYQFWLGVVSGTLGKKSLERKSYLKVLSLKRDHLQALIYLGHNQLESREYTKALINYGKALDIWPASPSALFNRALIATKFGRKPEAKTGWLEYLSYYPSGAMARRAVAHLNNLDDFSFRNYSLWSRTVTVEKIYFKPFTAEIAEISYPSLELIGAIFNNMKKGKLQLVVYQLKNKKLAKEKALSIKKFLLKEYPNIKNKDIGVSWFDSPEIIKKPKGKKIINESVSFFITM